MSDRKRQEIAVIRPGTSDAWIAKERTYVPFLDALKPGQTVLDGGAYIGTFALDVVARGCTVDSYEPDPANFETLVINTRAAPGVRVFNAALVPRGDWKGDRVQFHRSPNPKYLAGSALRPKRGYYPIVVSAVDWRDAFANVDAIKLDVEAAEVELLHDAFPPKRVTSFIVEWHLTAGKWYRQQIELLHQRFIDEGWTHMRGKDPRESRGWAVVCWYRR